MTSLATPEKTGDPLRPATMSGFVGQTKMKRRLGIQIAAARASDRRLDHLLVTGPPGMGKSTIAQLIADEMEVPFEAIMCPIKLPQLLHLLRSFFGVLLLDEIHRCPDSLQEEFLPLLQEGFMRTPSGQRFAVDYLTVIGATTEEGEVIAPLKDRFIQITPEPYSEDEMGEIIEGMAARAGVQMNRDVALGLGKATCGIPRRGRQFVLAARDLELVGPRPGTEEILEFCEVDPDGLTKEHNAYLTALESLGGTAGMSTLKSVLRLQEVTIREIERQLVNVMGLVTYSSKGRELTTEGYKRLRKGMRNA